MYPTYVVRSAPCAGRQAARRQARHLSNGSGFFPPALFSARQHPFFGQPIGRAERPVEDVFQHFDDFINRSFEGFSPIARRMRGPEALVWQPRFDVQEVENAYQLRGELPGVEAKDLEVEFTNANTLVIRGRTQTERTEGRPPADEVKAAPQPSLENAAENAPENQQAAQNDDGASIRSESSYVKPSVEDEADAERRESVGTETTADAPGAATPQTENTVAQQPQEQGQQPQPQQPRYWVSERSTGSFARSFEFPGRVDAEGVTASLKNGILDVNVPKAKAPEARRIVVQ